MDLYSVHLNTSYVKVHRYMVLSRQVLLSYLNTSYVKVHQLMAMSFIRKENDLNTSYVKVHLKDAKLIKGLLQ